MQSVLHQVLGPQEIHPENLAGRVAVVTGGALGIGYEVSRALAIGGCKVVMVNRKQEQGKSAIENIKNESPGADIDWKECDLGNLSQVKSVFSGLRESLDRLDYLVLSAGFNANQYSLDSDGIERIFGVNYLGQYYVTNQVWPLLRKTSIMPGVTGPRVVTLSSELHRMSPSNLNFGGLSDINDTNIDPTQLYARTKLALILFIKYGLLERVINPNKDNIYALAVHPGAVRKKAHVLCKAANVYRQVNTAMQNQWKDAYPGITGQLISYAMQFISRDPEQGSYSTLWALTAPEVEEKHMNGAYFIDPDKQAEPSAQASDPSLGADLWRLSEKLVKEKLGDDALVDWNEK
jgi:NAD(P)-dependent dehydrogenase (short-subunit alcohol dehydrogenase family)